MIKNGDVIAFKGTGFWSRAIQIWTRSPISHIGVALWIGSRLCVIESKEWRGVRVFPLDKVKMSYDVYPVIQIDGQKVVDFCLKHWGEEYSNWYQFVILGSRLVRYLRGTKLDLNPNKWFCSELLARAFQYAGYVDSRHPSLTTPGDICAYKCLDQPKE